LLVPSPSVPGRCPSPSCGWRGQSCRGRHTARLRGGPSDRSWSSAITADRAASLPDPHVRTLTLCRARAAQPVSTSRRPAHDLGMGLRHGRVRLGWDGGRVKNCYSYRVCSSSCFIIIAPYGGVVHSVVSLAQWRLGRPSKDTLGDRRRCRSPATSSKVSFADRKCRRGADGLRSAVAVPARPWWARP
jgi:hypothetical protein